MLWFKLKVYFAVIKSIFINRKRIGKNVICIDGNEIPETIIFESGTTYITYIDMSKNFICRANMFSKNIYFEVSDDEAESIMELKCKSNWVTQLLLLKLIKSQVFKEKGNMVV